MTSLLCVRQPGGTVAVHDTELVEELVIDNNDHIKTMYLPKEDALRYRARMKRPQSTPNPSQRNSKINPEVLIGHTLKLQDWLNEKSVKTIQEKADTEARNTKKMYSPVLETENTFVKDLDAFLQYKEMLDLRKKEILHKKWTEQVYEPIRKSIDREMNGTNYKELCKRKRELHKEYLEHVNRKGHVFLDTFAPDEYYPLGLHAGKPSLLNADTRPLRDPLLAQERERNEEDRLIIRCTTGANLTDKDIEQIRLPPLPLVPLGRHGTECATWLAMPMGDIESPVRHASRRRMHGNYNQTQINFDRWAKMTYNPTIVDEEMKTQRKKTYSRSQTDALLERDEPVPQSAPTPYGRHNVAIQVET